MSNDFRIGQILTSSNSTDRYLKVKIEKSKTQKDLGTLYFLIEINSPWFPATQVGQRIIELVTETYYKTNNSKNPEETLENALKKVNLHLAEMAQSDQKDWVGKLNAIIALIINKKIFIANTGNAQAYLFRNNNFSQILESNNEIPAPIKTFSSLVSGDFKLSDKILLCNNYLIDQIPFHNIRQIINDFDPVVAVNEISQILKNKKALAANAIIIESVSPEKQGYSPPQNILPIVYLDKKEPNAFLNFFINKKPNFNFSFSSSKNLFINIKKFFYKLICNLGYFLIWLSKQFRIGAQEFEATQKQVTKENLRKKSEYKEWENFIERPQINNNKFSIFLKSIVVFIGKLVQSLLNPKNRKVLIGILIIIAIIVIFIVVKIIREPDINNGVLSKQEQDLIASIESKINEAKLNISLGKKEDAKKIFLEAQNDLQKLSSSNQKLNLEKEIQSQLDSIEGVLRIQEPNIIADLSQKNIIKPIGLLIIENNLWTVNQNGKIYEWETKSKDISEKATLPNDSKNSKFITNFSDSIEIYDESQNIYEYIINTNEIKKTHLALGEFASAKDITTYGDRIYLLSTENEQIFRHSKTPTGWQKAKELIIDETDISQAVSLSIDGDVYVALKNTIIQISQGRQNQNFKIAGVNSNEFKPKKIFTNELINSIFVLDQSNNIWQLTKSGQYQRKVIIENQNIIDFKIDNNQQELYFITESKIAKIKI